MTYEGVLNMAVVAQSPVGQGCKVITVTVGNKRAGYHEESYCQKHGGRVKTCLTCGRKFHAKRSDAAYCGQVCRKRRSRYQQMLLTDCSGYREIVIKHKGSVVAVGAI